MAEQEPTAWELQRLILSLRDDIKADNQALNARLDQVVTRDAFLAEQTRVGERFGETHRRVDDILKQFGEDLREEREARVAGDAEQQKALDKQQATQRWVAVAVFLPIVLFLANIYFLYQRSKGG